MDDEYELDGSGHDDDDQDLYDHDQDHEDDESAGGGPGGLRTHNDLDEVLVVEAFGVHDNEVFARAWCSFWGVSAIMGDMQKTCMACCVREAYAVGVSVVVLTDSGTIDDEVEQVDREMEGL